MCEDLEIGIDFFMVSLYWSIFAYARLAICIVAINLLQGEGRFESRKKKEERRKKKNVSKGSPRGFRG